MFLAQISDLHIRPRGQLLYDHVDTNTMCARHIAYLNALGQRPDGVLITGDLTNCGLEEEYRMALRILRQLDYPAYVIPGNHDDNANMLQGLGSLYPELGYDPDAICYVVDKYRVRLIFLDSSIEGEVHGRLGEQQLSWLDTTLRTMDQKPTAICMHHHPVASGCAHMDTVRCLDGDQLITLLMQFPHVNRILCGHTHRTIFQTIGSLLICTAPSTAHQVTYDMSDPKGFYSLEPPAMLMHRFDEAMGFISYTVSLEEFDGPFRFETTCGCPEFETEQREED